MRCPALPGGSSTDVLRMSRLIIMGGGLIGRRHVERVMAHPDATCVGLIEPDPDVASELPVPRLNALTDIQADGVIIATPTPLHAEHAHAAAQANLPMLVEKPVAATRREAEGMRGLSVPVLVGHHRRHHPKVKALSDILNSGQIGQPITASLIWAMRKPGAYFEGNWRSTDGSPVMINLVHDLDLLQMWFGPVTDIAALPGTPTRSPARIDSGAVALRHEAGATTTISFADTAASPWGFEAGTGENPNIGTTGQDMLWITGTKGGIAFPSLTVWHGADWGTAATATPEPLITGPAPLDAQLDHFLDVIAGRAAPLCTVEDGIAALSAALEIEAQLSRALSPERQAAHG